jgi:hypothetical protein
MDCWIPFAVVESLGERTLEEKNPPHPTHHNEQQITKQFENYRTKQ